jgi:hypothetical protein
MKIVCLKDMEFRINGNVNNENCEHLVHTVYRAVLRAVEAKVADVAAGVESAPVEACVIQMPKVGKAQEDGYKSVIEESDDGEMWVDVPVSRAVSKRYVRTRYYRPGMPL